MPLSEQLRVPLTEFDFLNFAADERTERGEESA